MPSVVIEDFRYGLDTRRSALTSLLGTLATLTNAHINQGGEIEKRKAFVGIDLSTGKPAAVTIIGVQPVKDSIVILGRGSNSPGTWPGSLGDYTYQDLTRPDSSGGEGEIAGAAVVHSTTFNGKVFALVQMFDGTYNAFYDGEFIPDINVLGQVIPVGDLWGYLKDAINAREDYVATDITDGLEITSRPGHKFTMSVAHTGTWDVNPETTFLSEGEPPVPGRVASGFFSVEDGIYKSTAHQITSVALRLHDNTGATVSTTELLDGAPDPIYFTVDAETTARLVTESINNNRATSGYNAKNNGKVISIFANEVGDESNTAQIRVNTSGSVMIGKCSMVFEGTGFTIKHIKADGQDLVTPNHFVYPTGGETLTAFVNRVANSTPNGIMGNVSSGLNHGYVAMFRGNRLIIAKKLTTSYPDPVVGTDAFPRESRTILVEAEITVAPGSTGVVQEGDVTGLTIQIEPDPVELEYSYTFPNIKVPGSGWQVTPAPIRAIAVGGKPPYTYFWSIVNETGFNTGIFNRIGGGTGTDATGELTYLSDFRPTDPTGKAAKVQLDVTDASGVHMTKLSQIVFTTRRTT